MKGKGKNEQLIPWKDTQCWVYTMQCYKVRVVYWIGYIFSSKFRFRLETVTATENYAISNLDDR